jgi:hypothetical protein
MVREETEEMNRRHYYDKGYDFYLNQFYARSRAKYDRWF